MTEYLRINCDLAIPLDPDTTKTLKERLPAKLQPDYDTILKYIKLLQSYSSIINAGKESEENTNRAVYHICRNEDKTSCSKEVSL